MIEKLLKPTQTLNGATLDARVSSLLGLELNDLIMKSIERQTKWIVTTLPDRLLVTQKQFASLNNYTERMYNTSDRMFRTKWNIMEVIIDREIDTVEGIESILKGVDELTKLEEETDAKTNSDER